MSYDEVFNCLPKVETERLILRQISDSPDDGRDALEFINDINVYRFWGMYDEAKDKDGIHKPRKIHKLDYHYKATMKEYHAKRELTWLLELKETKKVIGEIVLYDFKLKQQADIGYRINKDFWGKGFAPEAGQAIIKIAFEMLELTRLQLRCFANNAGSIRVARKLGFSEEGLIRQGAILNVVTDYYIFGYLKNDFMEESKNFSNVQIIKQ